MFISNGNKVLFSNLIGILILNSLLSSCQLFQGKSSAEESQPEVVQALPAVVPELTAQEKVINVILAEADYALSQNKLLNPINDNAHDRYRSVLLIDPNNERARTGLQTIALRYVDLARTAAVRGDLANAQSLIRYARAIDNNQVVQDAAETLRKQVASAPTPKPYKAGEGEQILDGNLLKEKSPAITTQLQGVAQKAKQSGDFVLIVARNDAEGRWIYQQLRSAVPGFLVRGDIKIGQPARVKLVKSLE